MTVCDHETWNQIMEEKTIMKSMQSSYSCKKIANLVFTGKVKVNAFWIRKKYLLYHPCQLYNEIACDLQGLH